MKYFFIVVVMAIVIAGLPSKGVQILREQNFDCPDCADLPEIVVP